MNITETIRDLFHQPFFVGFLAIITCWCFYQLKNENRETAKVARYVLFALFAVTGCILISNAVYRIIYPQVWDFTCFYLWGKVAAGGQDFYKPENLHAVYNSLNLPALDYKEFTNEIVNVGFFYPPPTILYFAPLGYLSFTAALTCWTVFNFIFIGGSIYLIHTMFFKEYKLNGLLFVSTLVFIFLPSIETVSFSQTNFILLFYLLLMKKYEDRNIAGLLLALAFFTKPYMLIFGLFFLLRKKWSIIFSFMISAAAITGLTLALFGKEPFITYIYNNPVTRIPAKTFSENINQSLHAVLLRQNLITIDKPALYLGIVGAILVLTGIFLLFLLKRKKYDIIFVTLLLVGLLIYAGTLSYYAVLFLFIIAQFFNEKGELGFNRNWLIPLVGIIYLLTTFSVFTAICFLLMVIVFKSCWPSVSYGSGKLVKI